ncbi:MAG: carboxypeptidase regulatory-like domain-containing protein [Acidobacteria bacterium]|nr:carboxypeptidase regulatory-like domain-containing protein [Acidobacteriota bacterium]MBI3426062.1 carboxypeptidase regulatory-like domain-containing protein [Acidobacteriota bacterium]
MKHALLALFAMFSGLLCGVPLVAQTPSPTPAAAARSGTISGRVLGEDGAPAAFVTVTAYVTGVRQSNSRAVLTDAEGNFSLRDLVPGSYRLNASAPGYVSNNDPAEASTYHLGDTVTLNLVKGGVITGRVTTGTGEPVIALQVSALRTRDAEGKAVPLSYSGHPAFTDDNGVYRIYGLRAGSYLVIANEQGFFFSSMASAFDGDVPVYYPSSTRDTASEVPVTHGSSASGIDLRYRGEAGRVISGKVSGVVEAGNSISITNVSISLRQLASGQQVANGSSMPQAGAAVFELRGIPDGDYEIMAAFYDRVKFAASPWRRVQVRGTDVTGVDLTLTPLASVTGRVVLEAAAPNVKADEQAAQKCTPKRQDALEEVLLRLQRDEGKPGESALTSFVSAEAAPDGKGAFTLNSLQAGRYRMLLSLPSEAWYAKAITLGSAPVAAAPGRRSTVEPNSGGSNLFTLKTGDNLAGVTITLAVGAAALRGQVVSGPDNGKVTAHVRVHLLPAEAAAAEDLLRYAETLAHGDGTFQFKNLAPGKYWLLARLLGEDESRERPTRPLAWDATERARLRREAEAAKQEVELSACQTLADFKLQFTAAGRPR